MNPYAIPSLAALIVSICMGVYVLYKNPKSSLNRSFALVMLTCVIWQFGEIMVRISTGGEMTLFWSKFTHVGVFFIPSAVLYFALTFQLKKSVFIRNKIVGFLLFIPGFIFLPLLKTNLIISHVQWFYWGYDIVNGPYFIFYLLYYGLFILWSITVLISSYRQTDAKIRKKQIELITIWTFIPAFFGAIFNFVVPNFIDIVIFPVACILTIFAAPFLAYAILKYKLFIIEPKAENEIETPQKYALEKGLSYLVKEEKLDKSYEIFYDQVTHGSSGLSITKLPPEKVRERYRITKSPILWLTFKEVENAISPKDIEGVKSVISDFLGKAEKPVILLDCFDQLILANGFEKSMNMLREIKDLCMKNNANLLLSINPEMFEKEQTATIEKELVEVKA
ncbi:MAG: DUF835 domain-containing protein [Candidatus Thermoplasmatota archaeon]|nr:DUF835 domain-containing protein [Candidatus Thermoplasmatota archaeon]